MLNAEVNAEFVSLLQHSALSIQHCPYSSTTQPSLSWMMRLPYEALVSECVT
jgi:hypothetical protein